jgi:hypothetical protein
MKRWLLIFGALIVQCSIHCSFDDAVQQVYHQHPELLHVQNHSDAPNLAQDENIYSQIDKLAALYLLARCGHDYYEIYHRQFFAQDSWRSHIKGILMAVVPRFISSLGIHGQFLVAVSSSVLHTIFYKTIAKLIVAGMRADLMDVAAYTVRSTKKILKAALK